LRLAFLFLAVFKFSSIIAVNSSIFDTTITKDISEVVITGQVSETLKEDALHDVKVINSEVIRSGSFSNLAELLSNQLNLSVLQDNVLGSSISFQGLSGQNVKILIDEVSVIGRLNGNIDLSQISLNNIDRIEIIEGPLSVNYGTDALAATINIITKKEFDENKFIVNNYYETIGKYNNDFLISSNLNGHTASYEFSRKYFDGWSENDEFNFFPVSQIANNNRYKKWKPKLQIINKLQYLNNDEKFQYRFYIEDYYEKMTNLGLPRLPYFETAFDDYYYTFRKNYGSELKFQKKLIKHRIIFSFNKYKRIKNSYFKDLTNLQSILVNNPESNDTSFFNMITFKYSVSNNRSKKIKYQIGLHSVKEYGNGQRMKNNFQEVDDLALFANAEININNNFQIRPGFRVIKNSKYDAPLIPSFNLLYSVPNIKIRFSYAKGFRSPTLKELFLDFVDINHNITGNENLKAEISDNFRSSITYLPNSNFNFKLSVFNNKVNDRISLYEIPNNENNAYSYFNIGDFQSRGSVVDVSVKKNKIFTNSSFSYIGILNSLNKFDYSYQASLSLIYKLNSSTNFNVFYKYNGEILRYVLRYGEIVQNQTDSYNLLNASINKKIYREKISLSFGAKNIFNVVSVKNNTNNSGVHSSSSNNILIGYGRTFFTSIKFSL